MARLKDVQFSQGQLVAETQFDNVNLFQGGTDIHEESVPEQINVIFKLVKSKRGRTRIDGICNNVLNPKTQRRERIWLLMGADSIWQSELTEQLKDKKYVEKNRYSLTFENGKCVIPIINDRELEYARVHTFNVGKRRNGAGKFDFYEFDPLEEQKMRYEHQLTKIKTIQLISNMEEGAMKKLALYLGIKPTDEELGLPKSMDGIRTELLIRADTQPDIVNRWIGKPEVEFSYMIRRAIIEAKIDLANNSAMWASGKGFIAKIPQTRKPLEYLTELAMTNSKEGKQFKEQLETIIT